ncbi:hypothetical protein [Paenibacillus sp. YYML68]|uniref:hypothetical protein n=1 Tax=Paenibacillus sp. YYML68 TaxID=2909250 RepID=UPI002491F777|nr:hypothetical protein [Paenibacillus sp. YYML68]
MDDKKKIMMIHEIEHWRRSRLLPEQYCDFLLNLYVTEGLEKPKLESPGRLLGMSSSQIVNSSWKIWSLLLLAAIVISFTALNFNAFEIPMQIGVSLAFLVTCYAFGGAKRQKEPMAAQIILGMASLFLLFIGVYMLKLHGYEEPVLMVGYVFLTSVIWMVTGVAARLALFQLCGWVSLVFCYGWLLHHQLDTISWVTLEVSWVPLAILFCWLSWLIHDRSRQLGFVFFALGNIVWYMPELYAMLYAEQYGEETVQWVLLAKLCVQAAYLFMYRTKWTKWVMGS